MKNDILVWLSDILRAINEIELFFPNEKNFEKFKKDIKTQRAVERNIEIIGEAINRILKIEPDFQIKDARRIVDTRNRIIHGYDTVSSDIIWAIVIKYLPVLKEEVALILGQTNHE